MNITVLLTILDEIAPPALAAAWDNCGVQVAGLARDITRVAVALDPQPETVAACLDFGAEFVLTHHPLYLTPKAPKVEGEYVRVLRLVLGKGAWLFAAHTTLDAVPGGPAFWLGRELGLTGTRVLEPCPGFEAGPGVPGFGEVGELPEPLTVTALAQRLSALTGREVIQVIGPRPERVRTVAYCGGSGGDLIGLAAGMKADAYVTGDVKYHQALMAETLVFDVGHFSLEEEMVRRLAQDLSGRLGPQGVEVRFFPGRDPYVAYAAGPCPQGLRT